MIVNRLERTVEHRESLSEVEAFFGPDLVWSPHIAKRTVLQEASRRGVWLDETRSVAARDVASVFAELAGRIEACRAVG